MTYVLFASVPLNKDGVGYTAGQEEVNHGQKFVNPCGREQYNKLCRLSPGRITDDPFAVSLVISIFLLALVVSFVVSYKVIQALRHSRNSKITKKKKTSASNNIHPKRRTK
jgi:hypothetical protein